jgi:1-acyl-sn-glycerol-3-phosphate acyltransferase
MEIMSIDFSDIRYYTDEEFREIRMKFATEPGIVEMMQYFYPEKSKENVLDFFDSLQTLRDFQLKFVVPIVAKIIKFTTFELSYSGMDNFDIKKKRLFISNHRNIVLDAALMNYVLYRHFGEQFTTTANAIGHNLLVKPIVSYLLRSNKSFIVKRALKAQEMLLSSQQLSAYIRSLIRNDESSVWIAQREGRTKDGNDMTQTGLIKMLSMAGEKEFANNLGELCIVPVSISYELDPCVENKVRYLATIERGEEYIKSEKEDYQSMIRGTMGQKGRVHLHFGKEITVEDLQNIDPSLPLNKKVKELTLYIDKQIHTTYKLYPIHYFAADLLQNTDQYKDHYSEQEKTRYTAKMEEVLSNLGGDYQKHREIYLRIYANPLFNALKYQME